MAEDCAERSQLRNESSSRPGSHVVVVKSVIVPEGVARVVCETVTHVVPSSPSSSGSSLSRYPQETVDGGAVVVVEW